MQAGARRGLRIGAPVLGGTAAALLAIVGCSTITEGTPAADTVIAPAYRASVSASVSASSATSRIQESQRQASLTQRAVVRACESFAVSSKDAIQKVNDFVAAYNAGRDTKPNEGPAIEALSHSADTVVENITDPVSKELRDALNAYADSARAVATAIRSHAGTSEFNQSVNHLNDTKSTTVKLCLATR